MDQARMYRWMRRQQYGVVATVASDGTPQSALIGIATMPDLGFVFDTLKTSRKYANLMAKPCCSMVVGWTDEQTLQLQGIVEQPTGSYLQLCQAAYFNAWPSGVARMQWPNIAYFVMRPGWLRYSDYGLSPPLIWESPVSSSQ
jgi:pyridoxine/pyridoxamine 5'-phosphate oxidase